MKSIWGIGAAAMLLVAMPGAGWSQATTVSLDARYRESYLHKDKVVNGEVTRFAKGTVKVRGGLSLAGLSPDTFTSSTRFQIYFESVDPPYSGSLSFGLQDDPRYKPGATKAKMPRYYPVDGKTKMMALLKVRFNKQKDTASFKLIMRHLANPNDQGVGTVTGYIYHTAPPGTYFLDLTTGFFIYTDEGSLLEAISENRVLVKVKSKELTLPMSGDYEKRKIRARSIAGPPL